MLRHIMMLLVAIILFISLESFPATAQRTENHTSECVLSTIDADLSSAAQVIEAARRKLPKDLREVCRGSSYCAKPVDCSDLYRSGYRTNGPYDIWPQNRISKGSLRVYCDMTEDGGGWTVIQRRGDFDSGKEYFYRVWNEYKTGFGDIMKDFWIGNDNIFALTNQRSYQMKFDLRDWESTFKYATYDEFWIEDELRNYAMHVKGYRGTAGDSFSDHNGFQFSTKDRDNDSSEKSSCAIDHKGAWWYGFCHGSNLNGYYYKGEHSSYADGVNWRDFKGFNYSLKDTVMKIRPVGFQGSRNITKPPE